MIERPNLLAGEDLPPEPRQKRSIEKRTRLKQAALALFGAKGFEGASIEEIATHAGLAVGGFYQHFRSKRQLLLVLMNDLIDGLTRVDLRPQTAGDPREILHTLLSNAFARDFQYLGAYRAWQEAMLTDPTLARKNQEIHAWTTARVTAVFKMMHQMPGSRADVDIAGLARAMDTFFWSLLAQALHMKKPELDRWIDASTHLIHHALFKDKPLT